MALRALTAICVFLQNKRLRTILLVAFTAALLLVSSYSTALTDLTVFGPKRYDRLKGKPTVYTATFKNCAASNQAYLRITNGDSKTTRIRSAEIFINGTEVAKENEFQMFTPYFEKNITTQETNDIRVVLKGGKHDETSCVDDPTWTTDPACASDPACRDNPPCVNPGHESFLILEIVGKGCDSIPPTISNPVPGNGSIISNALPVISAQYVDDSAGAGIDTATVRMTLDGADVTSSASVTATGITYTPSSNLSEGLHTVTVNVSDRANNPTTLTWQFTTDTIVPVISNPAPANGSILNNPIPVISAQYADDPAGTGIDTATVRIIVDGTDVTSSASVTATGITYTPSSNLSEGLHTVTVNVSDRANNPATPLTWQFTTDTIVPVISNPAPANGSILKNPIPVISAQYADDPAGTGIATATVRMTLDGTDVTSSASVTATGITYTPSSNLSEGLHTVTVNVSDRSNNPATPQTWQFTTDTIVPVISNPAPANGSILNNPIPVISAQYADDPAGTGIDTATARIILDGADVTSSASVTATSVTFTPSTALTDGLHTVTVNVSDRANNPATPQTWQFTTDTIVPVVKITSHQNGMFLKTQPITISGTLDDPTAIITINGQQAQVIGNTFTLANFTLVEGDTIIHAEAKDAANNIGKDDITITLDTVPPAVTVSSPQPDSFLNMPTITVTGSITELHPAGLWINEIPVQITGPDFTVSGVPLALEGANNITVRATDLANNETIIIVPVTRDTIPPVVTITTPASGALVNTPQITVSGTVNEPITSIIINGTVVNHDLPFEFSGIVTLAEGLNTITVTALDRAMNPGTTIVFVALDSTAPNAPVITQPASPTKVSPVTITGAAEAGSSVNVYLTAPGSPTPQFIGVVTADAQGQFILQNVTITEGTNTFTATATDSANNTSQPSAAISVIFDTKPPVITITAPANNTYTNQSSILVTGTVDETATVTINGTPVTLEGLNFTQSVTLTTGINSIIIAALDPAGNPSSTTVLVNLDTTLPVVTITTPQNGAVLNTPQITVSGTVNEPVTSVTINNTPAQVSGLTFSLSLSLSEGQNTITAIATDWAGNSGTSTTVSLTLDTALPVISLNAPAQAAAGSNVTITHSTTENIGLTLSELLVNGMTIWSAALNSELSTQSSVLYSISPDLATGTVLNIQSRAYDTAGNLGTANAQIQISQGPSGPGYIQGEVYDDTKGLRLEGASVSLFSLSSTPNASPLTPYVTTEDGGYFAEASSDNYLVTLAKAGYTTVERVIIVTPEKNSVALDARLTPISSQQNVIDANGGVVKTGSGVQGQGSSIELTIPANALTSQLDIRLTPISNQGLAGVLPTGWSPVAVVDLTTAGSGVQGQVAGVTFTQPASLKIPVSSIVTLTPSSTVTVSLYDTTTHQWMVQNPGTVSSDGTSITASIPSTGQYAFVLPDESGCAALVGSVFTQCGSTPNSELSTPNSLTASGRVVPSAAPPSVGLSAIGEVILVPSSIVPPPSGLSSGLIVNARVTERFDLFSGEAVVPSDYVQDVVMYRSPCITNLTLNSELGTQNSGKVGSTFPVTPSHQYTIIDLMMGKVSFEITLPQAEQRGTMVGSDGARLSDTDGNVLVVPQNALTRIVPIETRTVQPALVSGVVGTDFTLLRAVQINLANQSLAQTAELSIPATQGLNAGLPIIVAKLIDVRGAGKLKLVALGKISGSLITSSVSSVSSVANSLAGITTSGTYLFIQAKSSLGFIKGIVTDSSGNPYPSALTTSSTCSLVDLTGIDGKYLIAGTVSGFTATATDIYKNDTGTATGTITAANQAVTLNLMIQITPPTVISAVPSPLDSKGFAEPNAAVVITFSEPVDKTTVTSANIVLKDAESKVLEGVFSISPENTVVTIYPTNLMKSEAQHTLTISKSIKDLQGYPMGTDFTSQFTVRDTTPPPLPPAGSITGSFPDTNGYVTITATQGSAEATGTVLIMNENSGEIVAVNPESNGSFIGTIRAMLGDEIKILSMDQAGNQTLITYITFKSDDGKYLVTSKGGIVTGEGGLKLDIPEGALLGPTVVKITPLAQDQLPHPLPERSGFLSGVNIDAGGAAFAKPVKLSVPAPSNVSDMPEGSMPFVVQPKEHVNPDGTVEKVYVVIDSAKIIDTSDGKRVSTASPPFAGIQVGGYYVFEFPYFSVAIIDGHTYREVDGIGGYQPVLLSNGQYDKTHDLPIKNAVIRTAGAMNYISYSRSDGSYAAFAEVIYNSGSNDICRDLYLTAIHPLTMFRANLKFAACEPPYNIVHDFNIKLADAATSQKDTTAPSISINMQVAPEQDAGNENARFTAGTIPVNTNINVPIIVTDQEMGQPTTLTVTYKTPDMENGVPNSVSLSPPSTPDLYIPVSGESPAVYKYTYAQSYPSPINGCGSQCFRPDKPGAYTFEVLATDAAGNKSSKKVTVRAVLSGSTPDGVDGPPAVDEIIPSDGAKEIMVTMPVMVTFSEPVQNVNSSTFKLIDVVTGMDVPASVYTSIEGGRMRATLQPKNNLMYGKSYKAVLTTGITDSVPNPSSNDALLPLDHQYEATFTTKVPQVYDLEASFEGAGTGDIALYTHPDGRTFTYVTSGEKGWHAVDVTDPTKPFVTYSHNMSNQNLLWRYRGAAVNAQSGILAITEWIQWLWAGGSMYGYVRFYDINANPAEPPRIGQERLAEEASGVPDKVAISGNFAFVTTLMVGLQVVDIEASKNYNGVNIGASIVGGLSTVDLEECPNPQNPSSRNCGSPSDIALIKNNLALIPTFSGSLLVVDVSTPQLPQLITSFRPQGYSARRIAATDEYAYTDESGNNMVIDLAVTSSGYPNGNIHTIDVTEPSNPQLLGVVKNASGQVAENIMANDITISKTSGLVYAAAGQSVYVIDIKDPKNPVILNIITETPAEPGSSTTTALGNSPALVEKDGWVYLANQQKGMRVLDLDPVYLRHYCDDPEFSKIPVSFCSDYYPALGEKVIYLEGKDANWNLLDAPVKAKLRNLPQAGITVRAEGMSNVCQSTDTCKATFNKGYAKFYITAAADTPGPYIGVDFEIDPTTLPGAAQLVYNALDNSQTVRLWVRNNSNVTLGEVLNGEEVFVSSDPAGVTADGVIDDRQKKFDFVKVLLNQVIPRARTLWDETLETPAFGPNKYALISEENGIYDADTEKAIRLFRLSFNMATDSTWRIGNTKASFTNTNGTVNYKVDDNTSDAFRKLMKDYGHRQVSPDGQTNDSTTWLNKIIDKETLVGRDERIPEPSVNATVDNADVDLNHSTNRHDTGLYELYKNAVERFVKGMIENAEYYSGDRGVAGDTAPKDDWVSRADTANGGYGPSGCKSETPPTCVGEHGIGMSYCNGCKQKIEEYNSSVSKWKAPPTSAYKTIPTDYAGNIDDSDGKVDNKTDDGDPKGTHKWPGLFSTEWNEWSNAQTTKDYYNTKHWTGIDCIGLVMRNIQTAAAELPDIGLSFPKVCVQYTDTTYTTCAQEQPITRESAMSWVGTSTFNDINNLGSKAYHFMNNDDTNSKLIHNGDVVLYPGHIATVFLTQSDGYQIIHASGDNNLCYRQKGQPDNCPFNRKVIVNSIDENLKSKTLKNPTGFGRIKLWD